MTDDFELPPMDEATARIVADAGRLPDLSPSRDLWAGIESRLAARADVQADVQSAPTLRLVEWTSRPAVRLAMAASLLVALTAGITSQLARRGNSPVPVAVTLPAASPSASPTTTPVQLASLDNTVATMDREIEQLEALLAERRTQLDPRTVQVLETSLAMIDRAIAASREALAADPASRFLAASYARAYTAKLTLLRDAATLPTGI